VDWISSTAWKAHKEARRPNEFDPASFWPIDRSMLGEVGDLGYYPAATEPLTREMPK
jgi:hypothetical protein